MATSAETGGHDKRQLANFTRYFHWEKIKGSLIRDLCEDLKIRRIKRSEQIFNNLLFKIEKNL